MTRKDLFNKYEIQERHDQWSEGVDNGTSISLFQLMHGGNIPTPEDNSVKWILDFLDKTADPNYMAELKQRHDWGILLLTAKRMVYRYTDDLLLELAA